MLNKMMLSLRRFANAVKCVSIRHYKLSQSRNNTTQIINVNSGVGDFVQGSEKRLNILSPDSAKHVDFSDYGPELLPTFNFAAYINKSLTLQKLIDLGVDLSKLEKRRGIPQFILGLDFERDMKSHIQFLHDSGVAPDSLGHFLTKNPLIFKEDLESLSTRVEYLHSKHYTPQMIAHVITANPYWLMFPLDRLERRLDFFKSHFGLVNDTSLQKLVCQGPKLITYNLWHVRVTSFSVQKEMGFNEYEMRSMVFKAPKIWMINNKALMQRFNYLHEEMKIPHGLIRRQPNVLLCRASRVKERHLFLVSRDLAQYNTRLPNYISLEALVSGTDAEFAVDVAGSSLVAYSSFLKTL
ncbi:hypothetical protein B566_EDAN015836 [Ephemera danica]|nr:hypothetical protein B566_EDAN015836 [Ephemera danica]